MTIELKPNPMPTFDRLKTDGGMSLTVLGLNAFATMALIEPTPGNRHIKLWSASKNLADAGWDMNNVLGIALEVNAQWENRKTEDEVEAAVRQAYSHTQSRGQSSETYAESGPTIQSNVKRY